MTAAQHRDARIELQLSMLLRGGVTLAAVVVLFGAGLYLASHGSDQADFHNFHPPPQELRAISGVLRQAGSLDGAAIIQLGMLLLIATPIVRVASSAYAFARQGDRIYVIITLLVLGILSYGLVASR